MLNPELPRPRRAEVPALTISSTPDVELLVGPVVTGEDPHPMIDRDTARNLAMAYRQSAAERALRITELVRELQERETELAEALARAEAAELHLAELASLRANPPAAAPGLPRQRRAPLLRRGTGR